MDTKVNAKRLDIGEIMNNDFIKTDEVQECEKLVIARIKNQTASIYLSPEGRPGDLYIKTKKRVFKLDDFIDLMERMTNETLGYPIEQETQD